MRRAITLIIGMLLAASGFGLCAQTAPAPATKPASKPAKPATKSSGKKAGASAAAKPAGTEGEVRVARRDPFESLVGREKAQAESAKNLPPGKAGLLVASLRLDGIVR
ncbi:MAG TPA: hypothetical protein VF740_14590, partial [Candidatus Acidoferrum sp.]